MIDFPNDLPDEPITSGTHYEFRVDGRFSQEIQTRFEDMTRIVDETTSPPKPSLKVV